jgi:hypothetical protein
VNTTELQVSEALEKIAKKGSMSNGNKKHLRNELHHVCFSQCFDKNKEEYAQLATREMGKIGNSQGD